MMFVLALKGDEKKGLFSVDTDDGDRVLYLFRESDDAERFVGLIEADDYPQLVVLEVEEEPTIAICEANQYTYVIIEKDYLVIPPQFQK